jgi:hypothetical protein
MRLDRRLSDVSSLGRGFEILYPLPLISWAPKASRQLATAETLN